MHRNIYNDFKNEHRERNLLFHFSANGYWLCKVESHIR